MSPVFLDTVGLLAIWNSADQWHGVAEAAYREIVNSRRLAFTSTYVLIECGNACARKPFRWEPIRLREKLESENRLILPGQSDWIAAWANYESGYAGNAGIVDQMSFVLLRRMYLSEVFSNDRHFTAAGFTTLF